MQTLTIGAYRATLKPTRDVGAFQAKLAKCNGKSRRLPLRDLRTKAGFPVFEPGMSTAEYVRLYSSGDGSQLKAWEWAQLNDAPCTLYSGEDTCETLPDGFDTWEDFDAAQGSSAAAESAPADAELIDAAEPVAPDDAIAPGIVPGFASRGARMLQAAIARSAARGIEDPNGAPVAAVESDAPPDPEPGAGGAPLATHSQTSPVAGPLATHSEPAPARPVYANDHMAWLDVENDRAEPDEYQARVIECFGEVKAGGLFYNSETYPATAALMTERYGYPDWRGDRGQSDGVANPFGMDCYRANSVIRARAERERERSAAATFTVGQRFARLIFNDGKQRTAAELVTLDPTGFTCKLKAKSGRNSVEITCSAYALSLAVIRAEERGKVLAAKRASARPEPVDPLPTQSDSVPVPGKLDAAPDRIEPDIFIRRATSAERMGNAPRQRAMRSLVPMAGHTVIFKPYGHKGAGFYWVLDRRADTLPSESDNAAPIECEPVHDVAELDTHEQPCAAPGLISYRARGNYGWIMIGAADDADAMREAMRSTHAPTNLQRWDGTAYVPCDHEAAAPATHSAEPAPVPSKSEPETVMLSHALGALQCIAPDGIPDAAMLAREADRIEATAERMRDAMPDYSATCATVARDLRTLADSAIDPLPGKSEPEALEDDETIPAPLDGLDVAELDDMVEFERAGGIAQPIAPAYRDDAPRATPIPSLRIPAGDPRARIPARFARVYLLQA